MGSGRMSLRSLRLTLPFDHSHDLCLGPCVEALGARIPDDVVPSLRDFAEERQVEQVVDAGVGLVATGWLAPDLMIGAARGGGFNATRQYHPATVHWRAPDGLGRLAAHRARRSARCGGWPRRSLTVTTHDHATARRDRHDGDVLTPRHVRSRPMDLSGP